MHLINLGLGRPEFSSNRFVEAERRRPRDPVDMIATFRHIGHNLLNAMQGMFHDRAEQHAGHLAVAALADDAEIDDRAA